MKEKGFALVRVLQRNRTHRYTHTHTHTHTHKEIYCKEMAQAVIEAEKFPRPAVGKLETRDPDNLGSSSKASRLEIQ